MRIGVDVRCLMDGHRTGVEEYTLGVLRAMIATAPTETFVLFANSRRAMHLPAFGSPNVEVRSYAYPNTLFNLSLKILRSPTLDALAGGVDVFFVPAFRLAPVAQRCPLVLTVHDLSFVRHPEFFSRERQWWHELMEPSRLVRHASALIAVSEATACDLESLYSVPGDQITVIPSGIPQEITRLPSGDPRLAEVRRRYQLPDRFILFLGTLEPRKNLDGLLVSYARIRRAGISHALVLAGRRGWIEEGFFRRVHEHPFGGDIRLVGFVEDRDKPAVYGLADVFVYPSFYEGFGFPPLEALACGTPVVTSANSAIPEVAGPWATLVNPYDADELAAVLIERLRDPARVPPDISDAIRVRYSWARVGAETLRVLSDTAQSRG